MDVSKNRGKTPHMHGGINGKPYQNGWFVGTIIFGNTQMFFAPPPKAQERLDTSRTSRNGQRTLSPSEHKQCTIPGYRHSRVRLEDWVIAILSHPYGLSHMLPHHHRIPLYHSSWDGDIVKGDSGKDYLPWPRAVQDGSCFQRQHHVELRKQKMRLQKNEIVPNRWGCYWKTRRSTHHV